MNPPAIHTVGHSTRSLEEFFEILRAFGIRTLVDIRTVPRSRHNPQFAADVLDAACTKAGVAYVHLKELGGLRTARKDSPNLGWRNLSFRGFADYMQTPAFTEGLARLEALAARQSSAIMCAEAVPWRCHRSLVSDALTIRGWSVSHIFSSGKASRHEPTPFLRVTEGQLFYPEESGGLFEDR